MLSTKTNDPHLLKLPLPGYQSVVWQAVLTLNPHLQIHYRYLQINRDIRNELQIYYIKYRYLYLFEDIPKRLADICNKLSVIFSERELTFTFASSRSLYAIARPSVVCLSVVCL